MILGFERADLLSVPDQPEHRRPRHQPVPVSRAVLCSDWSRATSSVEMSIENNPRFVRPSVGEWEKKRAEGNAGGREEDHVNVMCTHLEETQAFCGINGEYKRKIRIMGNVLIFPRLTVETYSSVHVIWLMTLQIIARDTHMCISCF